MPLSLMTLKIVVRFEAKGVCIRSTKFVSQREYGLMTVVAGRRAVNIVLSHLS